VTDLFSRVLYAGYIEHEPWGITRRKGHHEPIVSLETFERIQTRKADRNLAPARTDINVDFPLRGAVACADCNAQMTSCWSKSATGKRYPYFWCQTKTCGMYRKSIRAEKIDAAFTEVMQSLEPSKGLVAVIKAMLNDAWTQRMTQAKTVKDIIKRDIAQLDKQLDGLLDRVVESNNPTVINAYEKKIGKLERDKLVLVDKMDQKSKPKYTPEEIFELSMVFLANPWIIWKNGDLTLKKTVLRLVFKAPLAYSRESGFRTPQTSVIFRFLDDLKEKCKMVPRRGTNPLFLNVFNCPFLPVSP